MATDSRFAGARRIARAVVVHTVARARALWDDDPVFVILGVAAAVLVLIHAALRCLV